VYTNGSRGHADNVLAARGLTDLFDARYGIEDAGYKPKPERSAFEQIFALDGLSAKGATMVEDDLRNLIAPRAMGMRTLWVTDQDHVHTVDAATDNLTGFLQSVNEIR
jgi:putative hydrolase of the HAD superfamily